MQLCTLGSFKFKWIHFDIQDSQGYFKSAPFLELKQRPTVQYVYNICLNTCNFQTNTVRGYENADCPQNYSL